MSHQNHETDIIKEYTPEQAGERVGWVHIDKLDDQYVTAHIATATVGENGATLSEERDKTEGFSEVRGLYLLGEEMDGERIVVDSQELVTAWPSFNRRIEPEDVLVGTWADHRGIEDKTWADSPGGLLSLIKNGLEKAGAADFYPDIYYHLNGHVGHPSRSNGALTDSDTRVNLFFPDPEMFFQTREQLEIAEDTVDALQGEDEQDKAMLEALTPFTETRAEDIPRSFEISRLAVAGLEKAVMEASKSPFGKFIYLPVGFQPGGRNWPFMNAEAQNVQAFGAELHALKNKDIEPAQRELNRERSELVHRITYARQGMVTLKDLLFAESTAK